MGFLYRSAGHRHQVLDICAPVAMDGDTTTAFRRCATEVSAARPVIMPETIVCDQGMVFVDGGDDLGGGPALIGDGQGCWDAEGVVLAAGQVDVRGDGVAGLGHGDVG